MPDLFQKSPLIATKVVFLRSLTYICRTYPCGIVVSQVFLPVAMPDRGLPTHLLPSGFRNCERSRGDLA